MVLDPNTEREIIELHGKYIDYQTALALREKGENINEPRLRARLSDVVTRNGLPYRLEGKEQDIVYQAIDAYREYIDNEIETGKTQFTNKVGGNLETMLEVLDAEHLLAVALNMKPQKNSAEHNRLSEMHEKYLKLMEILKYLKENKENPSERNKAFANYIDGLPNQASKIFADYLVRAHPLSLIESISEDAMDTLDELKNSLSTEVEEKGKKIYKPDKTKLKNYINTTFGKLQGKDKEVASEIAWDIYRNMRVQQAARQAQQAQQGQQQAPQH